MQTKTPETPVLALGSDTGTNADDQVTRDTTPTIIGTAQAGSIVTVQDGLGAMLGTVVADGSGHYSFVTPVLADGTHSIEVTVTAPGETTSNLSPTLIFGVDTTPPAAPTRPTLAAMSDTGASHSDGLTARSTLVVVGSYPAAAAASPFGTPQDVRMELLDSDGTVLGIAPVAADGSYRLTTPALGDGAHALTVKAIDAAGNVSQASPALNVVVETGAATATSAISNTNAASAISVAFDVHFNEAVGAVTPADFSLVTTGTADGSVETVSGSGNDYLVTVSGLSGDGTVALGLRPGFITDAAGNTVTLSESDRVEVDNTSMPTTSLVSASASGEASSGAAGSPSASGRLVAFNSVATDLVPGSGLDGNNNVYVKDILTGALVLVSTGVDGPANGQSYAPSLSRSGTKVAFSSDATNLVDGGTPAGETNVYVATLSSVVSPGGLGLVPGSIELVAANTQVLGTPYLSADGSTVTFDSAASLTPGAETGVENVYAENLGTGQITLVSAGTGMDEYGGGDYTDPEGLVFHDLIVPLPDRAPNTGGDFNSLVTSISGDGNLIAYQSEATDLGGINIDAPVILYPPTRSYVYDVATGQTIDLDGNGLLGTATPTDDPSVDDTIETNDPVISADGSKVLFQVEEGGGDTAVQYLFEYNVATGTTTSVSRIDDTHLEFDSDQSASRGGGLVAFTSNPGIYPDPASEYLIGLINPATGEITDEGQGMAPQLTEAGNAIVYQVETADSVLLYETKLGISAGIDPIAGDDYIDAEDLVDAQANGGLAVSGTTNAPFGSNVLLLVYLNRTGLTSPTVYGTVDGTGHWAAVLPLADIEGGPGSYVLHIQVGTSFGNSAFTDRPFTIVTAPPSQPAAPSIDPGTHVSDAPDGTLVTNTATPAFEGVTAPFATISLYIGATGTTPVAVATAQADQDGFYSVAAPALADGSYGVEVQAVDLAGNPSPFSPVGLFTVDTTPPAPPSTPLLSGPHHVLPVTAVDADVLTLTGTAEPGATVTLQDLDANLLFANAPVAADGSYSLTSIPLYDGAYDLTVYATDAAGNVSGLSPPIQVTVDTVAPAAPVIADVTGAMAAGGSLSPALDVTGTAEPYSSVSLLVDGVPDRLDPTTAADRNGDFDLRTSAVPAGAHFLSVTATDAAGNVSAASDITPVTISATPVVPPGTPLLTGQVTDGPIANATVFADANGNGVPDAGEASGGTTVTGSFTLASPAGELIATDGTDTQTGVALPGALTAPAGATVIDPLTTLLDAYAAVTGQTAAAAQPALLAALGLNTTADLTTLDPVARAAAGDTSFLIAGARVMDTAVIDADYIAAQTGASLATAFNATFTAMAQAAAAGPLNLTDSTTVLPSLLTAAASIAAPGASLPATPPALLAASGNAALRGAATPPTGETAADYVAAIERVEQSEAAPQLATATGADAINHVLGVYTYELGDEISAAETAVLAAPTLAADSDSGVSAHDNSTADTSVTLTGTAPPGAPVILIAFSHFTNQTTVVGTGTADASGAYAIAATLSPFENDIVALKPASGASYAVGDALTLPAGLTGTQVTAVVVGVLPEDQSTVLPAIQDVEYTASSGNDATHTSLYVTGTGSHDIRIGATFTVTANGVPVSLGAAQVTGSFGIETTPLAAGTYDLVVTETAIDGETAQSQAYAVTVTAPGSLDVTAEASGPVVGGSVVPFDAGQEDIVPYPVQSHPNATTDASGTAAVPLQDTLPAQGSTITYATDDAGLELEAGGDSLDGVDRAFNLYAPPGSRVITPATSLLNQADIDAESRFSTVTVSAADYAFENSRIDTALGQPTTLDLATADPLAMAKAGNPALLLKDIELLDTSFLLTPFTQNGASTLTADPLTIIDTSLGIYHFSGFVGGIAPTIPATTIDFTSAAQVLAWMTTYDSTPVFGSYDTSYDASVLPAVATIIAAGNAAIEAHAASATSQADAVSYALAVERIASEEESTLAGLASTYTVPVSAAQQQTAIAAIEAAFTGSALNAAVASVLAQTVQVTGFTPAAASTAAAYEAFTITFSTPIAGLTAGDFTASGSPGLVGAAVTGVAPVAGSAGTAYTVTASTGVGNGTLTLGFAPGGFTRPGGQALGGGNFSASTSYSSPLVSVVGSGLPGGLAVGDFNGDGRPDVVTANDSIDGLTLYADRSDGSLVAEPAVYTGAAAARQLVTADLNGDGRLDVVTLDLAYTFHGDLTVSALLGNGDGTFGVPIQTDVGPSASDIATGDFTGDGKADLAVLDGETVQIFTGNGDGTFAPGASVDIGSPANARTLGTHQVTEADLNGDGRPDLVISTTAPDTGDATVTVLLGDGHGGFAVAGPVALGLGQAATLVAIGDVNGDGVPDIVALPSTTGGNENVAVVLGRGDGTFQPAASVALPLPPGGGGNTINGNDTNDGLIIGDVTGDGHADIVVSNAQSGVAIVPGNGDGSFGTGYLASTGLAATSSALALADFNGDGLLDLVATQNSGSKLGTSVGAGIDVSLNASPTVLPASASVAVARAAIAQPTLVRSSGPGTLTQSGTSYTLDLGSVAEGSTAVSVLALANTAAVPADSFDGLFSTLTGTGFTLTGGTLPAAVAAGSSYAGLRLAVDTSTLGAHSETFTFAPRDVTNDPAVVTTLSSNDASDDPTIVTLPPADPNGADVALELTPLTLTITDDVTAGGTPVAPTITGTVAGQSTTDEASIRLFEAVAIADLNPNQTETVTVTQSAAEDGALSDPNAAGNGGALSGDVYSVSGSAAQVSAALEGLLYTPAAHQVAPGQAVMTGFTIAVSDTAGQTASDATTSVVATAVDDPPLIGGTLSGQVGVVGQALQPFSQATLTDPDAGASITVTATLIAAGTATDADGTLSGAGLTRTGIGSYVLTAASPATEQALLQALVFTPAGGAVGSTTTTFGLLASDGTNSSANTGTTVTVTTPPSTQPGGTMTGSGSQPGTSTPAVSIPVYRFFDTNYGTHLFTQSLSEAQIILANRPDLTEETNNFGAVNPQTDPSAEAVYRFFETANGTHFLTTSYDEYVGLTTPGMSTYRPDLTPEANSTFYEDSRQQAGDVAVYRLFDTVHGTQYLTGSQTEFAGLTTAGLSTYRPDLTPEGVAFYAPSGSFRA